MNPLDLFAGYKSYIAGVGSIAFGVYRCTEGDFAVGMQAIVTGLGLLFVRRAVDR